MVFKCKYLIGVFLVVLFNIMNSESYGYPQYILIVQEEYAFETYHPDLFKLLFAHVFNVTNVPINGTTTPTNTPTLTTTTTTTTTTTITEKPEAPETTETSDTSEKGEKEEEDN